MAPAILPARRPYEVDDYTRSPIRRGGNAWVYVFARDESSPPKHLNPGRGYIVDDMSSTAVTAQQSSATPGPRDKQ